MEVVKNDMSIKKVTDSLNEYDFKQNKMEEKNMCGRP